jgi:hypothetical protein
MWGVVHYQHCVARTHRLNGGMTCNLTKIVKTIQITIKKSEKANGSKAEKAGKWGPGRCEQTSKKRWPMTQTLCNAN